MTGAWRWHGAEQDKGVSIQDDQGDDIAAALDRLHAGGWSIGDAAFFIEGGGLVHVVTGPNGENMIRAEGATSSEGWRRALDQATAVGMLPGWPRSTVG